MNVFADTSGLRKRAPVVALVEIVNLKTGLNRSTFGGMLSLSCHFSWLSHSLVGLAWPLPDLSFGSKICFTRGLDVLLDLR